MNQINKNLEVVQLSWRYVKNLPGVEGIPSPFSSQFLDDNIHISGQSLVVKMKAAYYIYCAKNSSESNDE